MIKETVEKVEKEVGRIVVRNLAMIGALAAASLALDKLEKLNLKKVKQSRLKRTYNKPY